MNGKSEPDSFGLASNMLFTVQADGQSLNPTTQTSFVCSDGGRSSCYFSLLEKK